MNTFWLIVGMVFLIGNILILLDKRRKNPDKLPLFTVAMIGIFTLIVIYSLF